jgi:hypothetical protein
MQIIYSSKGINIVFNLFHWPLCWRKPAFEKLNVAATEVPF